jgi:predicted Fe-Mo cluster-binding NifX family protein
MKVAIAVFRNVISPRLDTSDSLLIYDIDKDVVNKKEKCSLTFDQPDQLTSILLKKEITAVICGACPQYFSRILLFHGVDVLTGLTGEPENIIKMLISGQL